MSPVHQHTQRMDDARMRKKDGMNIGRSIHGIVARACKRTRESSDQANKKARGVTSLIILCCMSTLTPPSRQAAYIQRTAHFLLPATGFSLPREHPREHPSFLG
mmetsp:Transcript_17704/g.43166  ORF Transcript_17704/g.43166 Transcript_17704/m.43166 type:complete len:104 (+) Transcript_17704:348-659(+)